MKNSIQFLSFLIATGWAFTVSAQPVAYQHPIPFSPAQYVCHRTAMAPVIDGILENSVWQAVPWSTEFVDIEGEKKPLPSHSTRFKMVWDNQHLYIAAELTEPHVWAKLSQRDAVIFQDDDFEVFIDPDGDGKNYAELEINALNTVWDLLLLSPYYQHSPPSAINEWDLVDLKHAVHVDGSINLSTDTDKGWTVELAIPLQRLLALSKNHTMPSDGSTWRINFSRVDWLVQQEGSTYQKQINPATQRPFPERNWVWSPTGRIDMHRPEAWGWLQFSTQQASREVVPFTNTSAIQVQWALWQLYYSQRMFRDQYGMFAAQLEALRTPEVHWPNYTFQPFMEATPEMFRIRATDAEGTSWEISHTGQLLVVKNK